LLACDNICLLTLIPSSYPCFWFLEGIFLLRSFSINSPPWFLLSECRWVLVFVYGYWALTPDGVVV
jgi:hypothetical protein